MSHALAFLAGVIVAFGAVAAGAYRAEVNRPEMPVQAQPVELVRMVDLTLTQPLVDKNTTNRRQRFECRPVTP